MDKNKKQNKNQDSRAIKTPTAGCLESTTKSFVNLHLTKRPMMPLFQITLMSMLLSSLATTSCPAWRGPPIVCIAIETAPAGSSRPVSCYRRSFPPSSAGASPRASTIALDVPR